MSIPRFYPHLHLSFAFYGHTSRVMSHIFLPFLEPPIPFKHAWFLHSVLTISHVNSANVSLALLSIFTQNLMFIHWFRWLSLIFQPTVYEGHILLLLLLGNEWLVWSVTHVNTSWKMSKGVWVQWVCLTQHPSDTLRPFRELNYCTMYYHIYSSKSLKFCLLYRSLGNPWTRRTVLIKSLQHSGYQNIN
jgi:hypothetical protein